METKIIPFCLETAKNIQAGKIKGTIKTKNGLTCKIVSYCNGTDFFVERKTEVNTFRWCYPYTKDGRYIDGKNNGGTDYDLVLEVPDNEPKKLQFNSPYSIEQLGKLKEYTEQLMEVNQGVIDDLDSMIQELRKICNSSLKTEFKPFDKVLMRSPSSGYVCWYPHFYCRYIPNDKKPYVSLEGFGYEQCIPYEGNEHLVGTINSQN